MSYIDVYIYDGDAEEFDRDDPASVGTVDRHVSFTDGEELDAAEHVVGLLAEGVHFDVRHTRF